MTTKFKKFRCPYCGEEITPGADRCEGCLTSFTQRDLPQPTEKESLQKEIMTKKMGDFISQKHPPIIVKRNTSVREVIEKLQSNSYQGCVLVCDDRKKLIGIVSIRDILHKVAGVIKWEETTRIPVEKIMTSNPQTLPKEATLAYALHNMAIGRYRHVPIVENGVPIGVVSLRDIIPYLSKK